MERLDSAVSQVARMRQEVKGPTFIAFANVSPAS